MNEHKHTTLPELLGYLITRPQALPEYLFGCLLNGKSSFEQQLPWISYPAIHFLNGFLDRNMDVFEFGGGGSTLYFARKTKQVLTVENNEEWIKLLQKGLTDNKLHNAEVLYRPFNRDKAETFKESEFYRSLEGRGTYHVILVDGLEINGYAARPACFAEAEKHIKPGGIIIVDDSWRYPQLHTANKAKSYRVFKGHGPARKGLTQTDIYFY